MNSPGYVGIIERMENIAKDICKGRISFYLEGGYDVDALAEVSAGIVASFSGKTIDFNYTKDKDTDCRGKKIVDKVADSLGDLWEL